MVKVMAILALCEVCQGGCVCNMEGKRISPLCGVTRPECCCVAHVVQCVVWAIQRAEEVWCGEGVSRDKTD